MIRTDLALEAKALWERSAEKTTKLEGVRAVERGNITWVDILDDRGAKALGKPVGSYLTLELPSYDRDPREPAETLAQELRALMKLEEGQSVMVVGLGNTAVTPDALGPETLRGIFLTRHLIQGLPEQFGSCRSVSAIAPGVLATTGVESLELVRGAVKAVKPHCILCVDALAAGSVERLCNTVQCSDAGIAPGSGVGNCRAAFSKESLGVPVYAIGVPTVVDAGGQKHMILTPRDIDEQIAYLSRVLAGGINLALHPEFSYDDFVQFVPTYR
ncbi:MAG: GPR endopeptidase [Oscillospiraceae bacterium]|nr:GPR endopeptidase [Oscillospiraceae bacterium]